MTIWRHSRLQAWHGLAVALILVWIACGGAVAEGAERLTPGQRAIAEAGEGVVSARPGPVIEVQLDRPDAVYRIGDSVTLIVKAQEDAYITVFDLGTSGILHQLFPNTYQEDNFVAAGTEIEIGGPLSPFLFHVRGRPGPELIKVFATRAPGPLLDNDMFADAPPAGMPFRSINASPSRVAGMLEGSLAKAHQKAGYRRKEVVLNVLP